MVSPVFSSKLLVAKSTAETFEGTLHHETFYFAEDGGELLTVLDEDGNIIGGAPPTVVFVIDHALVADMITVDYGNSTAPVDVDLERSVQHGGFAEGDDLSVVYFVAGSRFDDVIRGNDILFITEPSGELANIINNPGNNLLAGGDGNDLLEGRGGADFLLGGSGSDTASYESSDARVIVTVNDPSTGGFSASGGDAQGDTLESIENLIGSAFDDVLTGASNNNVLAGGLGNDVLDGRGGTDTADYSPEAVHHVVVQLANGVAGTGREFVSATNQISLDGLLNIENVIGTGGGDTLGGNDQDNRLDGRNGNDTLDGGLGDDTLIGGGGNDTASFISHNSDLTVIGRPDAITLGTVNALGSETADGSYTRFGVFGSGGGLFVILPVETDVLRGIENVTGSNRAETITGNDLANTIDGRGGNDTIDGGLGNDLLIGGNLLVVVGGGTITSNDTVSYVSHDSSLAVGNDTISLGLNGADGSYSRLGFAGFPSRVVTVEADVLRGFENVIGSNRAETINGNEQDNTLAGRGGNDTVNGGDGNDTYDFRGGNLGTDRFVDSDNRVSASSGADRILIDNISDVIDSHRVNGNDLQITTQVGQSVSVFTIVEHFAFRPIERLDDTHGHSLVLLANGTTGGDLPGIITSSDAGEVLEGRGGDDYLFGNGGNDQLLGGADNDRLDGGKGNDMLDGGSGNDSLTGGKGHDIFVFAPVASDGLPGGNDVITDFVHGQDRIDLTAFHIKNLEQLLADDGHEDGFDGHGKHDGHHQDQGPITIETVGDDTMLSFAGGSIDIVGVTHLHASDFIV